MKISGLDHLVLTVKNIDQCCVFYTSVLGMEKIVFGEGRVALKFGEQKINLHEYGREFEPKAIKPTPGSADLCFITETKIEEVIRQMESKSIEVVEGPVERTGANAKLLSIYIRDPDNNLIEVANTL